MEGGKKGCREMGKGQNVLVLEFGGIKCDICQQEGTIHTTGKGKSEIPGINFDTVLLQCSWCQTEYLMPVFFLVRNKDEAKQRFSLIESIESKIDD